MNRKQLDARERVIDLIDRVTAPAEMTKREAREVIEDLIAELESKSDALNDEIAAGGCGDGVVGDA